MIPKNIITYFDKFSGRELQLLHTLDALMPNGYCRDGVPAIAKASKIPPRTVSRLLSKLHKLDLIRSECDPGKVRLIWFSWEPKPNDALVHRVIRKPQLAPVSNVACSPVSNKEVQVESSINREESRVRRRRKEINDQNSGQNHSKIDQVSGQDHSQTTPVPEPVSGQNHSGATPPTEPEHSISPSELVHRRRRPATGKARGTEEKSQAGLLMMVFGAYSRYEWARDTSYKPRWELNDGVVRSCTKLHEMNRVSDYFDWFNCKLIEIDQRGGDEFRGYFASVMNNVWLIEYIKSCQKSR